MRRLRRRLAWACLALPALWSAAALAMHPEWSPTARAGACLTWTLLAALAAWRLPLPKAALALLAGFAGVLLLWSRVTPSTRRDWAPELERIPSVRFSKDGRWAEVDHLRRATYREDASPAEVLWYSRTLDLETVSGVDFVVEPFASWRGPAHTFLIFRFDGGAPLAISAETRRERGEPYSVLGGLFRHLELAYVAGDVGDLLGLRTDVRRHEVFRFPVRSTRAQARALLVSMLKRADGLGRRPEFYNTLTNTCTTNIARHLSELTGTPLPPDLRVVLPGYADALAWEMGLIDFNGTLEEARERFKISPPLPK